MAKKLYDQVAEGIVDSKHIVVPAFIVFVILFVIAVGIGIEDYSTSYRGYELYPTNKINLWVIYLVAAIPQALQMGMVYFVVGFSVVDKKDRSWYGFDMLYIAYLVMAVAWLFDGYWDYSAKSEGFVAGAGGIYWPAVFESFVIYSIFSELLFSISFPMVAKLTAPGLREIGAVFAGVLDGVFGFADSIADLLRSDKGKKRKSTKKKGSKRARRSKSQSKAKSASASRGKSKRSRSKPSRRKKRSNRRPPTPSRGGDLPLPPSMMK